MFSADRGSTRGVVHFYLDRNRLNAKGGRLRDRREKRE